eukprot:SAG31_NODE_41906_length_274_cov_0.577143_1_plen_72_part_01
MAVNVSAPINVYARAATQQLITADHAVLLYVAMRSQFLQRSVTMATWSLAMAAVKRAKLKTVAGGSGMSKAL